MRQVQATLAPFFAFGRVGVVKIVGQVVGG